jgi:hypothetical protein
MRGLGNSQPGRRWQTSYDTTAPESEVVGWFQKFWSWFGCPTAFGYRKKPNAGQTFYAFSRVPGGDEDRCPDGHFGSGEDPAEYVGRVGRG